MKKCDFHDYVYVDTFEEAMNLGAAMSREMQCLSRRVQAGACSRIMKYVEITRRDCKFLIRSANGLTRMAARGRYDYTLLTVLGISGAVRSYYSV